MLYVLVLAAMGAMLVGITAPFLWKRPSVGAFLAFWLGVCVLFLAVLFAHAIIAYRRGTAVHLPPRMPRWLVIVSLVILSPFLLFIEWLIANVSNLLGVPLTTWQAWVSWLVLVLLFGLASLGIGAALRKAVRDALPTKDRKDNADTS